MYDEFRMELEALINAHSMENGSDTPDYVLAQFLTECLRAFDASVVARQKSKDTLWWGPKGDDALESSGDE